MQRTRTSSRRNGRIAEALALAVVLEASGCFWVAGAVGGLAGSGALSGSSSSDAPAAPVLGTAPSIARASLVNGSGQPSASEIDIPYTLVDESGASLALLAEWRLESAPDASFRAATPVTGSATSGLASGPPPGVAHHFIWAASRDLGSPAAEADVVLRLTPLRGSVAGSSQTVSLRAGDGGPRVSVVPAAGSLTRIVLTDFAVAATSGDDGFVVLTARDPSTGRPAQTIVNRVGGTTMTAFVASPSGTQGTVAWRSTDYFGFRNVTNVALALTATDRFGVTGTTSTAIALRNFDPPSISGAGTLGGVVPDGRVPVYFTVVDAGGVDDPLGLGQPSVTVRVSGDQGLSDVAATGISVRAHGLDMGVPQPITAIALPFGGASPQYELLWDSIADGMGGIGAHPEVITFYPSAGGVAGVPYTFAPIIGSQSPIFGSEARFIDISNGGPSAVALGDLDGDGLLDMVVANPLANDVTVRRGLPSGGFESPGTFLGDGAGPVAVALGDLDGDGALDLVVANGLASAVSVRLGRGDGGFGPELVLTETASAVPIAVALGDLNGDGVLDIVVANSGAGTIATWIGRGDGAFDAGPGIDLNSIGVPVSPSAVALGDLNGDGILDVVVANGASRGDAMAVIFFGSGGGFPGSSVLSGGTGQASAIALGDVDRDGRPDVAVVDTLGSAVQVWLNGGNGVFTETPLTFDAGLSPAGIALVDLNGDGVLDMVVSNADSADLTVRRGTSGGSFGSSASVGTIGSHPLAVAAGDLRGRGLADVVVTDSHGSAESVFGNTGGGGSGAMGRSATGGSFPTALVLADVNGDGFLDIAVANSTPDNNVDVQLGAPAAGFPTGTAAQVGAGPVALAAGSLYGDGDLDFVTANSVSGTVSVLRWRTGKPVDLTGAGTPAAVALGDLNGDGVLDLVVANSTSGVDVWLGDARATPAPFGARSTIAIGQQPVGVLLADLNGDGVPDLIVANTSGNGARSAGAVSIAMGDGTGGFGPAAEIRTGALGFGPHPAAVADLDGDGFPDLIIANPGSTFVGVRRGLGGGAFGGEQRIPLSGESSAVSRAVAVGDIDQDGHLDFVVGGSSNLIAYRRRASGPPAGPLGGPLARGDGEAFGLRFAPDVHPGERSTALAIGDVTQDGVADVISLSTGDDVLVSFCVRGSSPLAPGLRTAPAPPLDLAPLRGTLPAGRVMRQASIATDVISTAATFTAAAPLSLPMHAMLTRSELESGVFHVYRHEPALATGPSIDGVFGPTLEVARSDIAVPTVIGGRLVSPATVSITSGTISLSADRLGRYQAFLEAPSTTAVLLRETFDAASQDSTGRAPLPVGWFGSANWQCGVPSPTALSVSHERPAPASAPSLLGIGLRRSTRASANDAVTSTAFALAPPPQGRSLHLRLLAWYDLGPDDRVEAALVLRNPDSGSASRVVIRTYTAPGPGGAPALALDAQSAQPIAWSVIEPAFGPVLGNLDRSVGVEARLEIRFISTAQGGGGRGFYADDVELTVE